MAHPFSKLRDAMSPERREAVKAQADEILTTLEATAEEKKALLRLAEAAHEPCEDDTYLGGKDD
jgi:hypothetical protein